LISAGRISAIQGLLSAIHFIDAMIVARSLLL